MITTARPAPMKAPRICEDCGQPFPIDAPPADCYHCEAERRREEARERRERRDAELRRLLAEAPFERATTLARVALASAAEVLERGTKAATTADRAACLRRAISLVGDALNEIEAATAPSADWVPRWPAP